MPLLILSLLLDKALKMHRDIKFCVIIFTFFTKAEFGTTNVALYKTGALTSDNDS